MNSNGMCESKIEFLLTSKKHLERFVGALCTMNMDCVDEMIEAVEHCNGVSKYQFYSQLTALYDRSKKAGDQYFKVYAAHCGSPDCNKKEEKAFLFAADYTGNYFGLSFKVDNGRVVSFSECCGIRCPVAKKEGARPLFLLHFPF